MCNSSFSFSLSPFYPEELMNPIWHQELYLIVAYAPLLTNVCQTLIQTFILQVNVSLPADKAFLLNSKSVCLFLEISRLEI